MTNNNCCNTKEMKDLIDTQFDVLDKGFIRIVDYMGNDLSIVQAARVSYGSGTKKTSDDKKLIRFLMKNLHMGPFEMCEIKFHIKLPIFVARQWIRHRTANINEQSMRYSKVEDDFYIPASIKGQNLLNLQSSGDTLEDNLSDDIRKSIEKHSMNSFEIYEDFISKGASREISRVVVPVNIYTQWYWKTDLRNLLHFINLRIKPDAQFEIREYTKILLDIVKVWVPFAAESFEKYILNSITLSDDDICLLKEAIKNGKIPSIEDSNLTKSEYSKLVNIFS